MKSLLAALVGAALLTGCEKSTPVPEDHVCAIGVFLDKEGPCLVTHAGYYRGGVENRIHCFETREEALRACQRLREDACYAEGLP